MIARRSRVAPLPALVPRPHATSGAVAVAVLAAGVLPSAGQESGATAISGFHLTLRPERAGGAAVTAITVQAELTDWPVGAGERFVLDAPIVYAGVTGIADRVRDLTVRDRAGAVELETRDDPPVPGGFPYFRHWRANRRIDPPISISYRSLVRPTGERDSPPFGIRPSGGGVSGAGSGFLVLPQGDVAADIVVRWDLGDLPISSIGASTFGDGDFELTGAPSRLRQGWYMAGPAGRYPPTGDTGGFSATWLGEAPFDVRAEMVWAAGAYRAFGEVFGHLDPPPRYRVFMRFLETPPFGGGTALGNSFMLSRSADPGEAEEASPRRTFAHEMIHQWVGGIEAPRGVSSWFSEGLTSYYTGLLLMRHGHASVEDYREDINDTFRRYYTSPARDLSADSIATLGFTDPTARRVPYLRGRLYFADLDARIRGASGGERALDDLMSELFERRAAGERFDHRTWIEAIVREVGPRALDTFESVILRGETIVPASEAFGPCFRRTPVRFETEGGAIDGFEWVRVPGVPDPVCRGESGAGRD